ncbi:MAG: hypothetical protein HKN62_16520 [Phycisphaerales bacterium]|nr:hypothetical protein [Phycisphaerales bacterium]
MRALTPLRRSVTALPAAARFGAWFFIVFSLAHLAWVLGVKIPEPSGLVTLYQTDVAGETHRAWGLAYGGIGGLLLAGGQATLVLLATLATLTKTPRWRRRGHWVLLGWAALWMLGLARLAQLDHQVDSLAQATLATLLFGCTAFRAFAPTRRRTPPADLPPAEPLPSDIAAAPMTPSPPAPTAPATPERADESWSRTVTAFLRGQTAAAAAGARCMRSMRRSFRRVFRREPCGPSPTPRFAGLRRAGPHLTNACRRRVAAAGRRLGDRMARWEPTSTDTPA